jgi:hypothetical protein
MSDIVERLRGWFKSVNAVPAVDLMDAAADEITRLRAEVERLRMTDEDHEAVAWAARAANENWQNWTEAAMYDDRYGSHAAKHEARQATLRDLARRHGPDRMRKAPENVTEPIQEGDA